MTVEVLSRKLKMQSHDRGSDEAVEVLSQPVATRGRSFITSSREEAVKFSAGSERWNHMTVEVAKHRSSQWEVEDGIT